MSKKNTEKVTKELAEDSVCANELTGALQKVSIDHEELKRYHAQFNVDRQDD